MAAVAVITGGSSGIGRATAALFFEKGYTVYELSRNGKIRDDINHISCDITNESAVKAAFEKIKAAQGQIDVLVNNAGMGISGAVEFTPLADAQYIFDVNFFGALRCIQAALPLLRNAKGARIINLSSVAAPIAIPFQSFYCATKAATNALTLSLANELKPFNISVCAIMPGDIKTLFTQARRKTEAGSGLYRGAIASAVAVMEKDEQSGMAPESVARAIYKAVTKKKPRVLHTVGVKYKLIVLLSRLLPATLCNNIVGQIYK